MSVHQPLHGDPLSRIVQQHARTLDFDFRATGKGVDDIRALIVQCYNAELRTEVYAEATKDLMTAIERGQLPPEAEAIVTLAICAADAAYEAQKKA